VSSVPTPRKQQLQAPVDRRWVLQQARHLGLEVEFGRSKGTGAELGHPCELVQISEAKVKDWPAPMDRPAMARPSRSAWTR